MGWRAAGKVVWVIAVSELTKSYGPTRAVDGLSFTVRPGVVTGFLGPNGAGKSTTLRLLLGLDRADSGQALLGGVPYERLYEPLRKVGALLEAQSTQGGRSAYHHLLWIARSQRIGPSRVREVLREVGLSSAARRRTGGFSLGMAQRLGLAAALLGDPEILILDEPVNGLDPESVHWLRGLLKRLAAEGRTVLLSSHLMNEMTVTADHLIVIGRGRLLADASLADFTAAHCRAFVRLRTPCPGPLRSALAEVGAASRYEPSGAVLVEGATSAEVSLVARRRGVALDEISTEYGSLEEAFLKLTAGEGDFRTVDSGHEG